MEVRINKYLSSAGYCSRRLNTATYRERSSESSGASEEACL